MTVSPALRDPSRAGWIGAHVESPELLTALKSAIDVPKGLRVITRDFAKCGFPRCIFLQMSRGKCGFKIPFSGDRSLIQTYSDLEGILSTLKGVYRWGSSRIARLEPQCHSAL
jgi:hypothetical protein